MTKRKTIYHLILDQSGSMQDCSQNTINGFNEQLNRIKQLGNEFLEEEITIGLTTFNNAVTLNYFGVSPETVKPLDQHSYCPSGPTSLLDAIGITSKTIEMEIQRRHQNLPTSVVIVIITDGYENASSSFNLVDIKSLISSLEETGKWTFAFIGANLDAVDVAVQMSIKRQNSFSFDKKSMKSEVWDKINDSITTYCFKKKSNIINDNFFNDTK